MNELEEGVMVDEPPTEFTADEALYFWFQDGESSVEVESSNIVAVGFNKSLNVMHIKFASGTTYRYNHVFYSEFWNLITAESVGQYFAKNIRNCRDITCVREG